MNIDNLFLRMKELNISRSKISEMTGISSGNFSDWKSGRSMPSAVKLFQLADILNCSVDYLLGRETKPSDLNNNVKPLGLSESDSALVSDLLSLDIEDKAEIRGTVKQMLKAEKYQKSEQKKNA